MKRLLLLGGGHAHVEVLRQFGLLRVPGVDITLVSPVRYTSYSGMLPGLIAGHFDFDECHIDLARVARFAGARFLNTSARGVDAIRHEVTLADGSTLGYEYASINVGAVPAPAAASGTTDISVAVKPAETLLRAWETMVERAKARSLGKLVVVGGGTAGVELLLAMQFRLQQLTGAGATHFTLVTQGDRLCPGLSARVGAIFHDLLVERGVEVLFGHRITRTVKGAAITEQGARIGADALVWATGVTAVPSLHIPAFTLDQGGFIAINSYLQTLTQPNVFAVGDCAFMADHSYAKSGVYAVRQGVHLAANLRHTLTGKPLAVYRPQRRALALISSGDRHAVASYGSFAVSGAWVWRWKHGIDHAFVAKYNSLP